MKYYDTECEAHAKLKEVVKSKIKEPPLTVYFEDTVSGEGDFLKLQ